MATVKQPQLFVEVAKICNGYNFIMCGDGAELQAVKAAAPVNLKVLGMVDPSEVLPAADLFVSTSANEGIPYSILEAQAAGIPVLAVDAGAVSEIVHDGINGVLVGNNARDIAAKLIDLERNLVFRQKIGAAGLDSAKSKTMQPKSAELHHKLYRDISNQ
jgi:glycosyltransferase involved in cell wall biosynthesis